jgi:hypothetical protein
MEILFISISLSGFVSWNEMKEHGRKTQHWIETLNLLPNGIPLQGNTFNRFAALDPYGFEYRIPKDVK